MILAKNIELDLATKSFDLGEGDYTARVMGRILRDLTELCRRISELYSYNIVSK